MRYINELTEGSRIQGIYYCKSKLSTVTRAGKPYDSLFLQDKTGILDTKVWEPHNAGIGEYDAGDYIDVVGDVVVFNGSYQGRLTRIRRCEEGEYDPAEYMPATKRDINAMYGELLGIVETVQKPYYRRLLEDFFLDADFSRKFQRGSAAKTVHHAFIGGLLEHTLNVAQICDQMSVRYPILDRDLLLCAALLHDIGKLRELSAFPRNDYTDEGQMLGHIVIGAMMVEKQAAAIEDFPPTALTELQHCLLAHHGEFEYGSPKRPAIIEALALHLADNMDAKMQTFRELLESNDIEGWLGYNKFLDSNIRRT